MNADLILDAFEKIDDKYIIGSPFKEVKTCKIYKGCKKDNASSDFIIKVFKNLGCSLEEFQSALSKAKELKSNSLVNIIDGGYGAINSGGRENTTPKFYLVLEKVHYGNLFDLIIKSSQGLEEKVVRSLFYQIVLAAKFCSKNSLVKTIKKDSILLTSAFSIKITDCFAENIHQMPSIKVTEQLVQRELGIILFSLLTARECALFGRGNLNSNKMEYFWKKVEDTYSINLSNSCKDLINNLILYKFSQSTMIRNQTVEVVQDIYDKILSHPWMKEDTCYSGTELEKVFQEVFSKNRDKEVIMRGGQRGYESNTVFRSNNCYEDFFCKELKCKSIPSFNGYDSDLSIVVNNIRSPQVFMNELACICEKKIDREKELIPSPKKLKFTLNFEDEGEDEDNRLTIKVKLLSVNKKNTYIIKLYKVSGDQFDFYDIYRKIIQELD